MQRTHLLPLKWDYWTKSELFIYFHTYMVKLVMYAAVGMWNWKTPWVAAECLLSMLHDTAVKA